MTYSKNFGLYDFPRKDGIPSKQLIDILQRTRNLYGKSIYVVSGGRSPEHNAAVGGVDDSTHIPDSDNVFEAADLRCDNSSDRFKMLNILFHLDVHRIGIGGTFLHIDVAENKPQQVIWLY